MTSEAGLEGLSCHVLRACADQLAPVVTEIFNLSLAWFVISTFSNCLTSVVMKCFERLIKDFITSSLPLTLDLLQFP